MASSRYADYTPGWAANRGRPILDETPNIGVEPQHAPRLPTRLVPHNNGSRISAITLIETVQITQKILTYSAQEVANGIQYEFSDLRSIGTNLASLAKLKIEPFEEGSFIIPAMLEEKELEIGGDGLGDKRTITSRQVLDRFVDIIEGVEESAEFQACIGVVNAVEELGRIIRREATVIEYYPTGLGKHPQSRTLLRITEPYVNRVTEHRKHRQNIEYLPDSVSGRIIAIDLGLCKLRIKLKDDGRVVSGTFDGTAFEPLVSALNRDVTLHGVVGRRNNQVSSVRAIVCEIEDS